MWRERLGGFYRASPVGVDGKIYLLMLVLRARRKPEVIERNDGGERCIASPAVSNGQTFIRTGRSLYAVGNSRR